MAAYQCKDVRHCRAKESETIEALTASGFFEAATCDRRSGFDRRRFPRQPDRRR
jgi:hypothetical protein